MNAAQIEAILSKARTRSEKILWLGALLQRESGLEVVIVGGSAIEVYTSGKYVSEDVDIVGDRDAISSLLRAWAFHREGRLWVSSTLKLWIDTVGKYYSGERRRLTTTETPYGRVQIAAVEDLIAKRLIEIREWGGPKKRLFDQALVLAVEEADHIDWDYVAKVAKDDGAEDLVRELRRRIPRLLEGG